MIKHRCPECNSPYSLPDDAVGKRAKCKYCGTVFRVEGAGSASPAARAAPAAGTTPGAPRAPGKPAPPAQAARPGVPPPRRSARSLRTAAAPPTPTDEAAGIIPLTSDPANEDTDSLWEAEAAARAAQDTAAIRAGAQGEEAEPYGERVRQAAVGGEVPRTFAAGVLWTFLFPTDPQNLVAFVAIWLFLVLSQVVATFLMCAGSIVMLVVAGWYAAFCFQVVEEAAGGEEGLPSVNVESGWLVEYLGALLKWIGAWAVALLPSIVYIIYLFATDQAQGLGAVDPAGGVLGMLQTAGNAVLTLLVCLGVFLWPMIVLCVALGGFTTLYRPDLIVRTLIRTLPVYVLIVVLAVGSGVVGNLATSALSSVNPYAAIVVACGVELYLRIVACRCIGLYYHYFKDRFAWSWG